MTLLFSQNVVHGLVKVLFVFSVLLNFLSIPLADAAEGDEALDKLFAAIELREAAVREPTDPARVEGLHRALAIFEEILKQFPGDRVTTAKAMLHMGITYEFLGEDIRALNVYEGVTTTFTDIGYSSAFALYSMGHIRLRQNRPDEAARLFGEIGSRYPKETEIVGESYMWAGLTHQQMGNFERALQAYEEAKRYAQDENFSKNIEVLIAEVSSKRLQERMIASRDELLELQNDDTQWAIQSKNYAGTRYSSLNQITPDNVKNLKVAWSFLLGTINGQQGGPLVIGDTMYVHSSYSTSQSHNIFALDLTKEGTPIKWKYVAKHDPKAVPVACCDLDKGLQYANGKILHQTLDGMVIALDAKTGKELWKIRSADPTKGETNTAASIVAKDKYIVGIAGGEFGVGGWVAAYDINTGKQVWKVRNVEPDEELLLFGEETKSWPGQQWKVGRGTTSGYFSYDPVLNFLYFGSGNPRTWDPAPRKDGDIKWSTSVWARNPDTGEAKWAYRMTPWDKLGYDGINEGVLTEQTIGGKKRKVITQFDRNGFVYTLDRTDGTLLSADAFVYVNWAKGIDLKTGRPIVSPEKLTKQGEYTENICPSAIGAKSEQPAAYSPKTNLFYVSSNNTCMNYEGVMVSYTAQAPYVRVFSGHEGKDDWWGEVIAWDSVRGKRVWKIKEPFPVQSGPLVTATNVVFYGTMDGWFKAVDAKDGKLLWKHKVGSGIIGNPITYKGPDGRQYVAVYSGIGRSFLAAAALDLPPDDPIVALGGVKMVYPSGLPMVTTGGGALYVFALD